MAIGLALWPITLPVAAVVAIGAMLQAGSRDDAEPVAQSQWQPEAVEPAPVLPGLMQQQLAGLEAMRRQLRLLSHENVLERGFALVLDESGKPLRRASRAKTGSLLDIRLAGDQHVAARVEAGERSPKFSLRPKTKPEKAKPKPSGDGGQGQLL